MLIINSNGTVCAFDYANEEYFIFCNEREKFKEVNIHEFFSFVDEYTILSEVSAGTNLDNFFDDYPEYFL